MIEKLLKKEFIEKKYYLLAENINPKKESISNYTGDIISTQS